MSEAAGVALPPVLLTADQVAKNSEFYWWRIRVSQMFAKLHQDEERDKAFFFATSRKRDIRAAFDAGVTKQDVILSLIDQYAAEADKGSDHEEG